jgi:hypothetical protein
MPKGKPSLLSQLREPLPKAKGRSGRPRMSKRVRDLKNAAIKDGSMKTALSTHGLTKAEFARRLRELLDATYLTKAGVEMPDNGSRLAALRLWSVVGGYEAPKQSEVSFTGTLAVSERRSEQRQVWSRLGGFD